MKPYTLLIMLLFFGLGVSKAQQRTRDKLFPSFQQDLSALQQKERKQAPHTKDPRTTREQIFTDYHPQHNTRPGSTETLRTNRAATGKNASDISAEEALKTIKAREVNLPAPQAAPTQGNESERTSHTLKTIAPAGTPPAKTVAPATTPVRKSFERKKQ
ncbi:hypothetical protein [Chitinophaga sp. CF418]|uniref:hypothetical protein n=1 Tax=Chitinophaga sp. CF418 TaxID=1855287 RepID=UPI00091E28A0|nr:hypothetical protein [Chitinophaga sp. CF418]SHM98646.1 hypothetical protein SAMN05216311_104220 [Chitinophaga sp. CF418]